MKKIVLFGLIAAGILFVNGCEKKTPKDKAKDSIEKAAKDTADAVTDSAKKAEEAVKKAMKCQAGKCGQGKCGSK